LKQLQTHFKAQHEKGVGTPFPRVPAPLHPWLSVKISKTDIHYQKRIFKHKSDKLRSCLAMVSHTS